VAKKGRVGSGYWSTAAGEVADFMNSVLKMVFSRTLDAAEWKNTRLVKGDAVEEVGKLKGESGKDLFIVGSANLSSTLMLHGLIDEHRLGLTPVILGGGSPLFKPGLERRNVKLLEARPLKSGCVIREAPYERLFDLSILPYLVRRLDRTKTEQTGRDGDAGDGVGQGQQR